MLRFNDSKNVETVCLSEIADRITRKNKGNETDLPLTISSIDGLVDQRDYFNKKVASRDMSNYFLLKKGEFAYNKSYSKGFDYGSIKMLDKYETGALSPLYICFALKDTINKEYMCHYFDSQKWYEEVAMICTEGARNHGILNVSPADFMNMSLTLHVDVEEQQKIADCLSSVDAVITDYEEQVENMQSQKKGVMQKLFSQEVRFKADDWSEYPEWLQRTFADVGHVSMCKRVFKEQTSESGDVPFYKIGTFGQKPDAYISYELYSELRNKYSYPKKGAVLLSASGTLGRTVVFDGNDAYYQDSNIIWLEHDETILDCFLEYLYKVVHWQEPEGGTIKRLYNKNFLETSFELPCLEEQQKIADCLSAFDAAIEDLQKTAEHWKNIKKGLLQQLFA